MSTNEVRLDFKPPGELREELLKFLMGLPSTRWKPLEGRVIELVTMILPQAGLEGVSSALQPMDMSHIADSVLAERGGAVEPRDYGEVRDQLVRDIVAEKRRRIRVTSGPLMARAIAGLEECWKTSRGLLDSPQTEEEVDSWALAVLGAYWALPLGELIPEEDLKRIFSRERGEVSIRVCGERLEIGATEHRRTLQRSAADHIGDALVSGGYPDIEVPRDFGARLSTRLAFRGIFGREVGESRDEDPGSLRQMRERPHGWCLVATKGRHKTYTNLLERLERKGVSAPYVADYFGGPVGENQRLRHFERLVFAVRIYSRMCEVLAE